MSRFVASLRNHLHFVVIVPLIIIVMTWPTFYHVFDTELFWLPTTVQDVWINFWDAWHFELFMSGKAELLFTDLIFYPNGVSLAFDTPTYPHILVFNALKAFMPLSNAYNLTYLLIIFATTLSAYVYLLYVLRHKWISLFGAIVFGCSIYVIARPSQPIVTTIATVPLSLYFLHRAVLEKRWKFAVLSGILIGVTVVIVIYTYIILLIALVLYVLYFALGYWRQPDFWKRVALVFVIAGSIGLLKFLPMTQHADGLSSALSKRAGEEFNTDLLFYFVNTNHPVLTPVFRQLLGVDVDTRWNTSYLGYIPMALIAYGFLRSRYRRKMLFWLYLMIPFMILRLGSALTINGREYSDIVLPKELLDRLVPSVFEAIYSPDFFHSGALLPLAVLSCYGLMTLLQAISRRLRLWVIVLLIAGLAFEYYTSLDALVVPDEQIAFLDWLTVEGDPDAIRLVNVPMGRVDAKLYDFYQTLSSYPHAEGTAGRTPPEAYAYINDNLLLKTWSEDKGIQCQLANQSQYLAALDALVRDGFTHVVHHRTLWNSAAVADSFLFADAAYQDEFTSIYRLSDLRASCLDHLPGHESVSHLREFLVAQAITPRNNETILSLHETALDEKLFRFFREETARWKHLVTFSPKAVDGVRIQSSNPEATSLESIAEANSIIWLIYNPLRTNLQSIESFSDFFGRRYRSCRRVQASENAVFEFAVRREFPCELVDSYSTLAVRYESGVELGERLTEVGSDNVRVYLWWSNRLDGGYAYSIQVFDEDGIKAFQEDFVIGFEPLKMHDIDKTRLAPGQYSVRLIVYDFDTKQSQPGTILGTQRSFQRELEIARFTVTP